MLLLARASLKLTWAGLSILAFILAFAVPASATSITLTLTPTALGLGDDGGSIPTVNYGSEVLDDQSGLRTEAPGVGGSYLEINSSGVADDKANGDHLVTITSETHGDNTINVPANSDYYFGVLTLTDQPSGSGSGSRHSTFGSESSNLGGLGLRAFESIDSNGLRIIGSGGNAGLGGSKEVSGGTDDDRDFDIDANGAPHVDEIVNFDFDGAYQVEGKSIDIVLTKVKFGNQDDDPNGLRVALQISVLGTGDILDDGSCGMSQLDPSGCKVYNTIDDPTILVTDANGNVTVDFDAIAELMSGDIVTMIRISALDDDVQPGNLKGTAEHFLINAVSGEFTPTPEPSTALLMGLGLASLASQRRRRRQ
jgi:hypothetical protein